MIPDAAERGKELVATLWRLIGANVVQPSLRWCTEV